MAGTIGMTWYTPEGWERMRAIADDRRGLTFTFDEYCANAETQICELEAQGFSVEKVVVDVDELVSWCRRNGYRVDHRGRAACVAATSLGVAG